MSGAIQCLEYCMPPLCVNFLMWATTERGLRCEMVCGGAGDVVQNLPLLDGNGWSVREFALVIPKV